MTTTSAASGKGELLRNPFSSVVKVKSRSPRLRRAVRFGRYRNPRQRSATVMTWPLSSLPSWMAFQCSRRRASSGRTWGNRRRNASSPSMPTATAATSRARFCTTDFLIIDRCSGDTSRSEAGAAPPSCAALCSMTGRAHYGGRTGEQHLRIHISHCRLSSSPAARTICCAPPAPWETWWQQNGSCRRTGVSSPPPPRPRFRPALPANAARQLSVRAANCVRGQRREFNPDSDLAGVSRFPADHRVRLGRKHHLARLKHSNWQAAQARSGRGLSHLAVVKQQAPTLVMRPCHRELLFWPPERSPRRPSMPLSTAHSSNSSSGTERRSRRSGGEGRAQVLQHREPREELIREFSDRLLLGEVDYVRQSDRRPLTAAIIDASTCLLITGPRWKARAARTRSRTI